jgi:hypothetical protein
MKERLQAILAFILDRAGESSTWQGLGFLATLAGAKFGGDLDWGAAAAAGGLVSALLKTLFPDKIKKAKA